MIPWIAQALLRLMGWRVSAPPPDLPKYLIIAAPHTSNWDFVFALLIFKLFRLDLNWMGKDSLFRWPFGIFFRAVGGLPVDRSKPNNRVEQAVQEFRSRERMKLLITPEGTRKKTSYWKSGFYYIALGAGVPILLGFIDYKHKIVGIGPGLMPSGDVEADLRILRAFYEPLHGKYPDQASDIRFRSDERTPAGEG